MKIQFLFALCVVVVLSASAQKTDKSLIPPAVIATYKSWTNDSLPVVWEKKGEHFEGRFSKNHKNAMILIGENGEWQNTQWIIPHEYLPRKARQHIYSNFYGYKIRSAIVEYRPGGVFFLVGTRKGSQSTIFRFSARSEFIGPEPEPEDKKK